jgi:hypothetical protein
LLWIFGAHRLDQGSTAGPGAVVPSFRFQAQAAKNSPLPGMLQLASLSRTLCQLGDLRPYLLRRPN